MASKFKIIANQADKFDLFETCDGQDVFVEGDFETLEEAQSAQADIERADRESLVVNHAIDLALEHIMQALGCDRDDAMYSLKEMLQG